MKPILELVSAISPYSLRKTLGNQDNSEDSLTYRLYELMRKGLTDEDAVARKLYGKKASSLDTAYRSLKNRLSRILVDAILGERLQKPSYRTYDEAYEHGYRQLEVSRILMGKRLYGSAREIASQTFRRVQLYENPNLNLGLTDILSSLYLGVAYNEDLFNKYHGLYVHYTEVCRDLNIVTDHYRQIRNHVYANRLSPAEIGDLAIRYTDEDRPLRERNKLVPVIQTMFAQTELTGLMLMGKYLEAIASAEEGISVIYTCKGANLTAIAMLALSKIDCTIKLRDFTLGLQQIEAARQWVPKGTINELKIYEHAIRLGLLTENYEFAYQSYVEVEKNDLKKLLTPRHQEFWTILTAYIQMLILAEEIVVLPHWPAIKPFRLSSFLNDVPANVRNKRGTNIQILILQAVILILQGKHGKMIDRTDALSVYCNRYLRGNSNLRNNGFFKLLLTVIQTGFKRKPAERKAARTLLKMKMAEERGYQNDLEIIPYENLWNIILGHLEKNKRGVKSLH